MTGIKVVNLKLLIESLGESTTTSILSDFSCPLNPDVENFLKRDAIEFAKQGLSAVHLVMMNYKEMPVMVGYFALANKYVTIRPKNLSKTNKKKILKFSTYNEYLDEYSFAAPLIGQLGKNFKNGYNDLITGDQLLKLAVDKLSKIQLDIGGKWIYLECEDKQKLIEFYKENGFIDFGKRQLEKDETDLQGQYLVQMLRYIK